MILSPVASPKAKPRVQQIWEMLSWGSRLVVSPTDYKTHQLYIRGRAKHDALRFLSGSRSRDMLVQLNIDPELLENKLLYSRHFGALNLPVPRNLAVIGSSRHAKTLPMLRYAAEIERFILSELSRDDHVVLKPIDGREGRGVSVLAGISRDGGGARVLFSNGEDRRLSDLVRGLAESERVWLVQRRLKQHPILNSLNATSVNTIRLGTFRRSNGTVEIAYAVLRIGRSSGQIDGYGAGGVAVRLDPVTGALDEYGQQKPTVATGIICRHPDSGVQFRNLTMPNWPKTLSLARKFAAAAGGNRFVGWDVAMTVDGPVFIEGNDQWNVQLAQVGSRGLLSGDCGELLRSETGIEFDTVRLPRPKPLRAFRMLRSKH